MSAKLISFAIFVWLFVSALSAQYYLPQHPSMFPRFKRLDTGVDTVLVYLNNEPVQVYKWYTRSEDMLTDTMHTRGGSFVHRYNEKNQLLYAYQNHLVSSPYGDNGYERYDYEYDKEGRVVRLERSWVEVPRNQSEIPAKKFLSADIWDYSSIRMTEKGYILEQVECELDGEGRITHAKYFPEKDVIYEMDGKKWYHIDGKVNYGDPADEKGADSYEGKYCYISYPGEFLAELDGNIYRVNDVYYTYTDNSYTEFTCRSYSNRVGGKLLLSMDKPLVNRSVAETYQVEEGELLGWMKGTLLFNENGDEIASTMSVSYDNGINWEVSTVRTEYVYNNNSNTYSGDGEVSNENLRKTNTVVYARSGTICISAENAATVQIFDLAGRTVKQQALSAGENRIGISTNGFYIVRVGNESFKVFIKSIVKTN